MAHSAEQYIKHYDPLEKGMDVNWICMDERFAVVPTRYRQTAGGAVGVGMDASAAMLMAKFRGEQVETAGLPPVHAVGAIAAAYLHPQGIVLNTHEGCAAESAAPTIRQAIVDRSEPLFRQTQKVKPGMTPERFNEIGEAFAYVHVEEDTIEAARQLDEGRTKSLWTPTGLMTRHQKAPRVERVPLIDSPHVSGDVLVNNREHSALDVEYAFLRDVPAYHISMGDQKELVQGLHEAGFVFDQEDFEDVSAVRHAATTMFLPVPEGQDALNIHHVH